MLSCNYAKFSAFFNCAHFQRTTLTDACRVRHGRRQLKLVAKALRIVDEAKEIWAKLIQTAPAYGRKEERAQLEAFRIGFDQQAALLSIGNDADKTAHLDAANIFPAIGAAINRGSSPGGFLEILAVQA